MKERNKVANVFTSIAPEWNNKGNLIASCIEQKNPFKTEYKNNGLIMLIVHGTEYLKETFPYCHDVIDDSIGRFPR